MMILVVRGGFTWRGMGSREPMHPWLTAIFWHNTYICVWCSRYQCSALVTACTKGPHPSTTLFCFFSFSFLYLSFVSLPPFSSFAISKNQASHLLQIPLCQFSTPFLRTKVTFTQFLCRVSLFFSFNFFIC